MPFVTSADGTRIGHDDLGDGPPIVFVGGAFALRNAFDALVERLAGAHRCLAYDRRARGESGDTRPFAVERELDDLDAVIEAAGGDVAVFGYSSGAVLALAAASRGSSIHRLLLYEPSFRVGADARPPADLADRLEAMVDGGRPDEAVAAFQREAVGLPEHVVAAIREAPFFPGLVAMARSVVYDARLSERFPEPDETMARVTTPVDVVRGLTWPFLVAAADRVTEALPDARLHVIEEARDHGLAPAPTAGLVVRLLSPENGR